MAVCDPDEGMHDAVPWRAARARHPRSAAADRGAGGAVGGSCRPCASEIAGIIVEPLVQGAGGMRFHDAAGAAAAARRWPTVTALLLIFDEIFTGFGRTGTMFACEAGRRRAGHRHAVEGADRRHAAAGGDRRTQAVFDAFWSDDPKHALMHGPTFMANPLACAAANASLDLFEREPRLAQVRAIGEQLERELASCRDLKGVTDVRVMGAIGVVELDRIGDLNALRARFVMEGVFVRPFGNVVYLTPPLVIAPDELTALTGAIGKVLRER